MRQVVLLERASLLAFVGQHARDGTVAYVDWAKKLN